MSKKLEDCRVVIVGAGAAGTAIAKLFYLYAEPQIIAVDSKGIISTSRIDLNEEKKQLLGYINGSVDGSLEKAITDADIFIGVSKSDLFNEQLVSKMAEHPIIFGLANPTPAIMPDIAKKAGVAVITMG